MATVRTEFEIAADAADIWAVIRRFDTGPLRMAPGFVTDCTADGDHRRVTFADGTVVHERLVSVDEDRMRVAYSVVGSDVTPEHDNAVMQVVPLGPGRSRFVWLRDLLPAEMGEGFLAAMRAGSEYIERTLAANGADAHLT
ncbi:SRPBCC family protein [Nocardia jiangxiensis]|uniref:SRPBCC family protein n=1 Tax=Nocardia jiangxiensis TaxID=282685 RepID=UPI0002E82551|nr:SRPBCC family protein [Nocardia jiangxiensis]